MPASGAQCVNPPPEGGIFDTAHTGRVLGAARHAAAAESSCVSEASARKLPPGATVWLKVARESLAVDHKLDIITVTVYINSQVLNVRPHPPPDTDPAPHPAIHFRYRHATDAGRDRSRTGLSLGQRVRGAFACPGP